MNVKVYVEGGGQGKLRTACRSGFSSFFDKAGPKDYMPRVVACGSRDETLKRFQIALNNIGGSGEVPILLVDSEGPVQSGKTPWQHLRSRDNWKRPDNAQEDQAHLMVQFMESWFLADVSELESFFRRGSRTTSQAQRNDIEQISKEDVLNQLKAASRGSRKGAYRKGRHSFDILAQIDPEKVIQRSRFAKRLVETLKGHLIPT